MVPELRKRHRLIWQVWALLLPIGFVLAILVLPKQVKIAQLPIANDMPFATIEESESTEALKVNLRAQAGLPNKQLEIILTQPLDVPSARVYWQNTFLGSLGAKGTQYFILDSALLVNPPFLLEIRNPIDQTVFQKITFTK